MTREEALNDWLPIIRQMVKGTEVYTEALDMAIKALEQQPTDAVDRVTIKEYLYSLGMGIKVTATDAVDRQTALEAFGLSEKSRKYGGDHSGYDTLMKYEIQDILEDLPSVTPQPCEDAISRQVVLEAIDDDNRNGHYSCFATNNDAECFKQIIRELPSVTPQQKEMT